MKSRRGLVVGGVATLIAIGMAGCSSSPPEGAWVFSPITVSDGKLNPADITYGSGILTDDTDGGFWYVSGGSWLRSDVSGKLTRFNIEKWQGNHEIDVAAFSPTELYVLLPLGQYSLSTTIEILDTTTQRSAPFLAGQRVQTSPEPIQPFTPDGLVTADSPFGPITSIDVDAHGRLVFVERVALGPGASDEYVVRRLLANGSIETLAGVPALSEGQVPFGQPMERLPLRGTALAAASVDISAGDPAGVVVGTEHGVFQIREDGTAHLIDGPLSADSRRLTPLNDSSTSRWKARPVDAATDGLIIVPFDATATATTSDAGVGATPVTSASAFFEGGSSEYRALFENETQGPWGTGLAVVDNSQFATSTGLKNARVAVWVAPGVLVVASAGGQDNAALARVRFEPTR